MFTTAFPKIKFTRQYTTPTTDPNLARIANSVEEYTNSMKFKNLLFRHPFKAYCRTGSMVFGFVFMGNLIRGLTDAKPIVSPYEYPELFAITNLGKSLYFGLLWPSVPFMLTNKRNRDKLFIIGKFMEDL